MVSASCRKTRRLAPAAIHPIRVSIVEADCSERAVLVPPERSNLNDRNEPEAPYSAKRADVPKALRRDEHLIQALQDLSSCPFTGTDGTLDISGPSG